jgi:serine-type D-Ala-D-Ala carboxypeptidase/endopeptidase (penicillin-binding protein 4)
MKHPVKRFLLCLFLFLAFLAAGVKKDNTDAFAVAIQAAQNKAIFCTATIGCYAVNLTQDQVLGGFNATRSMIPASTLKLLTTAAALEILGRDFRFETVIQYDGEVDAEGTLHGHIYIKGGGDPALGSRNFQDHYYRPHFIATWVQAIQAKGIKKVTGAVIGDAQIYTDPIIPDTWVVGDLGEYYGAAVSGLSIFDNIYRITLQATEGHEKAFLIEVSPPLPEEVQIISQVKSAAIDREQVYVGGWPHHPVRVIQGEIPCGNQVITLESTSPDPVYWAAYTLHRALQKQHIEVVQPPTTMCKGTVASAARRYLCTTLSPPLSEIITKINHDSLNSYAEHLLKHLSLAAAGPGDTLSGTQALRKFWSGQGIDITGMLIRDGSGLSRHNAFTPRQLVEALRYMRNSDNAALFYESLPIAGETGNLATLFKKVPLRGNLRAKSGSLSNVRSFAGYCTNQGGDEIAFAIIVNHYDGPRSMVEKALEEMLEALVRQK